MDVAAVREHFRFAQGEGAQQQSALAVRTRSGVAINVWRTYGARLHPGARPCGALSLCASARAVPAPTAGRCSLQAC